MGLSFNGAMTSQPWILLHKERYDNEMNSLQWSHDLSAMDTLRHNAYKKATVALQWSHDLSAMDTLRNAAVFAGDGFPSMEP